MGPSPCRFAKQTTPALWLSTPASHARGKPGLGRATGCPVSSSLSWALCPELHAQPRSCPVCSWSGTCYLPAPRKALPSVLMEVTASGPELSRTSSRRDWKHCSSDFASPGTAALYPVFSGASLCPGEVGPGSRSSRSWISFWGPANAESPRELKCRLVGPKPCKKLTQQVCVGVRNGGGHLHVKSPRDPRSTQHRSAAAWQSGYDPGL